MEDAERVEGAEDEESTERRKRKAGKPVPLKIEGATVSDAGFAGVAALDAADAVEFFAAALEIGFDGFDVGRRHNKDHAHAHIEGLQQFIGLDFSELRQKL